MNIMQSILSLSTQKRLRNVNISEDTLPAPNQKLFGSRNINIPHHSNYSFSKSGKNSHDADRMIPFY